MYIIKKPISNKFQTDMYAESRLEKPHPIYVPRDEAFEELKQGSFSAGRLRAVLHTLIPSLIANISADTHSFQGFHHIDNLYKEGLRLKLGLQEHLFNKIPLVQKIQESSEGMLRYDTPRILSSKYYLLCLSMLYKLKMWMLPLRLLCLMIK